MLPSNDSSRVYYQDSAISIQKVVPADALLEAHRHASIEPMSGLPLLASDEGGTVLAWNPHTNCILLYFMNERTSLSHKVRRLHVPGVDDGEKSFIALH